MGFVDHLGQYLVKSTKSIRNSTPEIPLCGFAHKAEITFLTGGEPYRYTILIEMSLQFAVTLWDHVILNDAKLPIKNLMQTH